jgi:tetratricopeptide (TPR) repeat protein
LRRETQEGVEEAIRLLKKSVDIDPGFARAWTRLSLAYYAKSDWWGGDHPEEVRLRFEAAQRAVQLDPQDADAHEAYAEMLGNAGDYAQSKSEFDKAVDLNPNSADILTGYASWLDTFGSPEEAVEMAERAMRLNPNVPFSANGVYRVVYFEVGRYKDALRFHLRRPKQDFGTWDYIFAAMLAAELGHMEEARAALAENMAHYPDTSIEGWVGRPMFADWERQLWAKSMRKAGFPVCASEAVLKQNPKLVRMPECLPPRASN